MSNGFSVPDIPEELAALLPEDPFEQLDVAWRIAHRAYAARVRRMEADSGMGTSRALEARVAELEQALSDSSRKLGHAMDEQSKLSGERNALVATVKKLNRDVAKLETFKRTLMQQLQDEPEEDGPSAARTQQASVHESPPLRVRLRSMHNTFLGSPPAKGTGSTGADSSDADSVRGSEEGEGGRTLSQAGRAATVASESTDAHSLPPSSSFSRASSLPASGEVPGTSATTDHFTDGQRLLRTRTPSRTPLLTPHFSPHITPGATPPFGSAAGSPKARPNRVDGKEFFRQARNRLTHDQFSEFLANIKELNAHRQSRETTLRRADEIFGSENKDLCVAFDGLLSRHLPS